MTSDVVGRGMWKSGWVWNAEGGSYWNVICLRSKVGVGSTGNVCGDQQGAESNYV